MVEWGWNGQCEERGVGGEGGVEMMSGAESPSGGCLEGYTRRMGGEDAFRGC